MAEPEKKLADTDEDAVATSEEKAKEAANANYVLICLIGYSMSFIIFGSQVSILGPTIRPLSERLGVDEPSLSPLFTALGISCIISGAPSGWLVDAVPTHYVLIGSLLVQAIGFSLVPLMPSVISLTALWFVICFSYNFTNSAVFTSLTWMFPQRAGGALNLGLSMTVTVSMILLVFLSTTAETSVGNWINTYSQAVVGLDQASAAWVNAAFWGSFTIGRVVGALISHMTTPAGLLLSFTPLSVIGTSIPMIAGMMDGLGNAAGYANAVALMERYVPVTGATNGVFGMVAGGACMVGPNLVAMFSSLYGYTDAATGEVHFWYQAMAWVGLFFYSLHFPAIFTALIAGSKLRKLHVEQAELEEPLLNGDDVEDGGDGVAALPIEGGSVMSNKSGRAGRHYYSSPISSSPIHAHTAESEDIAHGFTSFPGHIPTVGSLGSGGGSLSNSLRRNSLTQSIMGGQGRRSMASEHPVSNLLGGRSPLPPPSPQ
eukprot:gene17984-24392_t